MNVIDAQDDRDHRILRCVVNLRTTYLIVSHFIVILTTIAFALFALSRYSVGVHEIMMYYMVSYFTMRVVVGFINTWNSPAYYRSKKWYFSEITYFLITLVYVLSFLNHLMPVAMIVINSVVVIVAVCDIFVTRRKMNYDRIGKSIIFIDACAMAIMASVMIGVYV